MFSGNFLKMLCPTVPPIPYDKLKTEFEQLNVINRKQETELCKLKNNSIEIKNNPSREREKFDSLQGCRFSMWPTFRKGRPHTKQAPLQLYGRRQNLEFVGIPYEKMKT